MAVDGRYRPGEPEPVLVHADLQGLGPLGLGDVVDPFQHDTTDTNGESLPAVERDSSPVEPEGLPNRCRDDRHTFAHHTTIIDRPTAPAQRGGLHGTTPAPPSWRPGTLRSARLVGVPGSCDPRFLPVREAFEGNFAAGLEAGAACAVAVDGRLVVDLWGGSTDGEAARRWQRDTLVDCRSATKGLTALCLAILADEGLVDFDAPLRRYWPELRADPTVRQALSHQAGVPIIDGLAPGSILDWGLMATAIAGQEPMWPPGDRHGYHGVTFGWLIGEPVRRVTGLALPDFLARQVFDRFGVEGSMGTPPHQHARMARLLWGRPAHGAPTTPPSAPTAPTGSEPTRAQRMYAPVLPPLAPPMNDPAFRTAAIPVTGAAVTARTFALIYGELACDGGTLVSNAVARALGEVQADGDDAILGIPVTRTLGYERTPSWADDGRPAHCWGSPGGGGVVTFVDPEARVGFAYLNNASWAGPPGQDPRSANLTKALYSCL